MYFTDWVFTACCNIQAKKHTHQSRAFTYNFMDLFYDQKKKIGEMCKAHKHHHQNPPNPSEKKEVKTDCKKWRIFIRRAKTRDIWEVNRWRVHFPLTFRQQHIHRFIDRQFSRAHIIKNKKKAQGCYRIGEHQNVFTLSPWILHPEKLALLFQWQKDIYFLWMVAMSWRRRGRWYIAGHIKLCWTTLYACIKDHVASCKIVSFFKLAITRFN